MLKKYVLATLSIFPIVAFSQHNVGDTTTMDEVIISENRLQIPFAKQGRNIEIITKEDIAKIAVKSINEVLSYIGGVDVRQRGPFGGQADIAIDGGSFEQTLILLNGVKISDPQTGHHSMNIPVPLEAVERIEILKGPAARVYGINALTGAINIITSTEYKSAIGVYAQTGSSFKNKEEGDGNGIYAGAAAQLIANLNKEDHRHLFAVGSDRYNGQRYNSAVKLSKVFYQGGVDFSDQHSLNWMAGYIDNRFGASGYYASPIDKEAYEVVKTGIYSLSSRHSFADKFQISPRLSYRNNKDDYRFYRHDLSKARSQHTSEVLSAELNTSMHTSYGDYGFGMESRFERIVSTNIGDRDRKNYGSFLEFKTEKIKNVFLNIGTYINYNTQYGWQVFPGLDVAYKMNAHWKLAFNVGSSQRIPSFTDLYLNQAPANIGNPDLTSENAWQHEESVHFTKGKFKAYAGYFYRNISDYIDWTRETSAVPYQPQNFGQNMVHGLSAKVAQDFTLSSRSHLGFDLSYNYLNPVPIKQKEGQNSKYALEMLNHQALLRATYGVGVFDVSWGNRLVKRQLNDAYLISDLRVGARLSNWRIYTDITNIFDATYKEVAAVPLPSRWVALGTSYVLQ